MLLCRDFKFDAAHNLIHYHGKCERLHGHTYHLRVVLEGEPDAEGMIFDFVDLKKAVNELVLDRLDHAYINDIVEQPTAEYISRSISRAGFSASSTRRCAAATAGCSRCSSGRRRALP